MIDERALLAPFPAEVLIDPRRVALDAVRPATVLVVLDDDPTGTQSVADIPVLTSWEASDFAWAFKQDAPAVYVLTNTRSLDAETAAQRNREIVTAALTASVSSGITVSFASRGDSTLRGHFPLETDVIAETVLAATGSSVDAVIIVPAFPDAGRITIDSVHYMRTSNGLTPVAKTEFARDATFGYANSNLRDYVAEKSHGRWAADDVVALTLDIVRGGTEGIVEALSILADSTPVVVDIVTENDLRALALGLAAAEDVGKNLLYRVGPPFVRARIGQAQRAPLDSLEVFGADGSAAVGGLIVVGSHVGLTTRQLSSLIAGRPLAAVLELDIEQVLGADTAKVHLAALVETAVACLAEGDVVIHTSRMLHSADDADESLDISRRVSAAVVELVQQILAARPPRFVIAKGGITSSDVASHGLGIRHAIVRGPMLPGLVSLWEPVDGPAQGIPYIVFAGNVGGDESLTEVVTTLSSIAA
ncbi:four-carbon acid sugar kinase family protein [Rhodoglobus vestalii]|nr:four-carbon acid sugar kinase family protein [Rhodoglobus vestalii]